MLALALECQVCPSSLALALVLVHHIAALKDRDHTALARKVMAFQYRIPASRQILDNHKNP
jgi:hypothetical protein